jgi:ergothioneine biosynthesis protein EgtB
MSYHLLKTSQLKKDSTKIQQNLLERFLIIRKQTESICNPLEIEDYVVQPKEFVSPPKWHLGHTTWFFETMILLPYFEDYKAFDANYNYIFNSYYETIGVRVIRTDRGNLSRPSVENIYKYRKFVDEAIQLFFQNEIPAKVYELFELGLQHEQQHQELLVTDIKYILGNNPLFPSYNENKKLEDTIPKTNKWISIDEGVYEIGFEGTAFCFDNELNRHKVYLNSYQISSELVTNKEYLEFINSGGYENFKYWHAEGWDWVQNSKGKAPMYWHFTENQWHTYTLNGLQLIEEQAPVTHINFYEAFAFASWSKKRLPTEAEWEVANEQFNWGKRWEWTQSAYLPYPGFTTANDATGEYNGKFMVNQMVLRGASIATAANHSRPTYRNFFQTNLQWQFTGIRLAQ